MEDERTGRVPAGVRGDGEAARVLVGGVSAVPGLVAAEHRGERGRGGAGGGGDLAGARHRQPRPVTLSPRQQYKPTQNLYGFRKFKIVRRIVRRLNKENRDFNLAYLLSILIEWWEIKYKPVTTFSA